MTVSRTVPRIDLANYSSYQDACHAIDAAYACEHETWPLTQRVVSSGAVHLYRQCANCGYASTSAVSKADWPGWRQLPPFDESAHHAWQSERSQRLHEAWKWFKGDRDAAYQAYLLSADWARRRELVLARSGGQCEGCRERSATLVHHLTYEHLGEEFLWELVAVCDACDARVHPGQELDADG